MLLAHNQLLKIIEAGYIDALPENVNAASIDIRLGDKIYVERKSPYNNVIIDLSLKQSINWREIELNEDGYRLSPNEFILAHSIEVFNLPNNLSSQFILRSSMARNGLEHLQAGWADAGFKGANLTFELKNVCQFHTLLLKKGMRIGQMVFFEHEDSQNGSYALKGRYNDSLGVVESKGES